MTDFLKLAQEAYDASTTYIDSNYRNDWDYSIRAFRNEHAAGSKYLAEDYKARSRIFSPKTRSIIRKNEAAAMQAAFSNREVVQVDPGDPSNPMSVASSAALKEVMEYRLDKTIPTFQIYCGGVQDAQTMGAVCSYQYWEYEQRNGKNYKDKPCIDLRPLENIRFDAGASWLDPVNTSPYFCDIIPMYVCDVKAMMVNKDDKTGSPKWKKFDDKIILQARPDIMDSTRKSRLGNKQDPVDQESPIKDFDIVWVMRWFMKEGGEDRTFYTLGTEKILTDAKPIDEVYFHGVRPYVMGYAILETHKAYKSSMPTLVKPVQLESTDLRNQRLDNVKFVLNKRWFVARGRQVDVQSLVRNVPGGVTLTTDPKNDIQESNWPDVTSSAFVEHDRLNAEFDDLAGNFSPSTKVANNAINDTLGGSKMAAAGAGLMTEYLLHTINTTWWTPVMRQLALLEQYYETDDVILTICAKKAKLFPHFGPQQISEMLTHNDASISVSMAMGDPNQRMQKFIMVTEAAIKLRVEAPPGSNIEAMTDELYANAGYRDGARFFNGQANPQLEKAMQLVQHLKGLVEGKQMELQAGLQDTQLKLASNEKIKAAQLQIDQARISGDLQVRQAELELKAKELQLEEIKLQLETRGSDQELQMRAVEMQADIEAAQVKLQGEREKQAAAMAKAMHETEMAQIELQAAHQGIENEHKIGEVAGTVEKFAGQLDGIHQKLSTVDTLKSDMEKMGNGLGAVMLHISQPQRKPNGIALKKDGKKTKSVVVSFDDGTQHEMSVQ